jgi:D-3-phosphoglycerate dehydrogenase
LATDAGQTEKRLAVDLDGVLTEHPRPLARAASARFGIELPESAFVDSAGLNVPDAVRVWVYGPTGPAAALRPAPGAQDLLARLMELFGRRDVLIITARPAEAAAMTTGWLRRHGFPECEVFFADDKVAVAAAHGCTHAIEDSVRHARRYAAAHVGCVLLAGPSGDGIAPAPDEPGVVRVADLAEAVRHLAGLRVRDAEAILAELPPAPPVAADRPTIVVSDAIHPLARARFEAQADVVDVDGTDVPALLAAVRGADALVVRSETLVTPEVLAAAPRLRVVARAGVGVDTIDLAAATRAGVVVLNAPGANAVSAGEHTIALLLAIARQLPFANASTHAGEWARKAIRPLDLRGRRLGIVGVGRVGAVVATRMQAFEMEVVAFDPHVAAERFLELGVQSVGYEELLATSDVVTFHVPATSETHNMLDARAIERLKPTAIVLNCARGEVVDEVALAAALREGRIAGAGVDVFPHEPCRESPLFGLPNAVLTPHTGGSSAEALAAVGEVISTTTLAALRGEAVPNAVNLPAAAMEAPVLQRLSTVAGAAGHLLAVLEPELPPRLAVAIRGLVPTDVVAHVTGAALAEALQRWTGRRVTPVNARLVAQELGIQLRTTVAHPEPAVAPEFTFEVEGEAPHRVTVSWDRTNAAITEVDRFSLPQALAGDVLITHHHDVPGVIGRLGTILGRYHVNIAGMQVGRHQRGGEALMVLNVDDPIPEAALAEITATPGVANAYVVSLPPAEPRQAMLAATGALASAAAS